MDLLPMLAAASGAGGETDDDFASTVLLLHGDGTNGAQNNTFLDSSTNNFTITRNGNTTQGSFAPFSRSSGNLVNAPYDPAVHGGSGYFDNTGDYLTAAGNAAFDMSTGDFTWEGWAYIPSDNTGSAVFAINGAELFFRSTANGQKVAFYNGSVIAESDTAYSFNQWNHVAVTRSGTTLRVYLNGVSGPSATHSSSVGGSASTLYIGSWTDGSSDSMFGWLSSVRIVKGTAVYTGASFTPPTTPLTAIANTSLLCNFTNAGIYDNTGFNNLETVGNAQIDTTTKQFGTGSLEFDGTGDYLVLPASDNWALGSGSFTVEFWVNASAQNSQILSLVGGTSAGYWQISLFNGSIYFQSARNAANAIIRSYTGLIDGTWHHLAFCREGTTLRCFFDGVLQGATATDSTNYNISSSKLNVGFSTEYFNGYIDDLRITKGVARYTTTFTPPAKAFPNIGS